MEALLSGGADPNLQHTHGVGSALCAAVLTHNEMKRSLNARIALVRSEYSIISNYACVIKAELPRSYSFKIFFLGNLLCLSFSNQPTGSLLVLNWNQMRIVQCAFLTSAFKYICDLLLKNIAYQ